jgi:hypothetical protein
MATSANRIQAFVLALAVLLPAGASARMYDPFKPKEEKSELISFSMKRWYSLGRDAYST